MRRFLNWYVTVLFFFAMAVSPVSAEQKSQTELYMRNSVISADMVEAVITFKNDQELIGFQGQKFSYGMPCIANPKGEYLVLAKRFGSVLVRYFAPNHMSDKDECPDRTETSLREVDLRSRLDQIKAQLARDNDRALAQQFQGGLKQ